MVETLGPLEVERLNGPTTKNPILPGP